MRGGGWLSATRKPLVPLLARWPCADSPRPASNIGLRSRRLSPPRITDTKAAVRWLRANAASQRLNPESIGAIGGSAGGHLVFFSALTSVLPELEGDGGNAKESSRVQAVVAMATDSDLLAFSSTNNFAKFVGVSSRPAQRNGCSLHRQAMWAHNPLLSSYFIANTIAQ